MQERAGANQQRFNAGQAQNDGAFFDTLASFRSS